MKDHNLPTPSGRGWFDRLRDRLGEWLFAAEDDARAQARGLQVVKGPRGVRTYRDPRWDGVRACAGTGIVHAAAAVPVADGGKGARS